MNVHLNGFGGFTLGYFSGLGTALFIVATTAGIIKDVTDIEEFREWKAERDANTIDSTAKDIPVAV